MSVLPVISPRSITTQLLLPFIISTPQETVPELDEIANGKLNILPFFRKQCPKCNTRFN
jgi:hypothetical protein